MVEAIVLAAGASSRFGAPKLLAPAAGQPLVRWTVEHALASRAGVVHVVLGGAGEGVRAALAGLPIRFVESPRWRDGLSASLAAGVRAVSADASGVVVLLGDQPTVRAPAIDAVIEAFDHGGASIVASAYRGERGHPVIFSAALFPELLATAGDRGARDVIARDPARVRLVELGCAMPRDVDTAGDLAEVERLLARGA